MPRYWVYGLCLDSDVPLAGMPAAHAEASVDLRIEARAAGGPRAADADAGDWACVHRSDPCEDPWSVWGARTRAGLQFRLAYGTEAVGVEFLVGPAGSIIRVLGEPTCTPGDVEALLLGPVLTCALRARGLLCLHGSVVDVGGRALVLLGESGAGKSTTATGLRALGASPLADDVAAIAELPGGYFVQPGPARLRLRPDVVAELAAEAHLSRVWPDLPGRSERRYLELDEDPTREPVPLAGLYHLGERRKGGDPVRVEPLAPALGLMTLLRNVSADFVVAEMGQKWEFARLAQLARDVPMRVVRRTEGLASVEETCRAILDDAAALHPVV